MSAAAVKENHPPTTHRWIQALVCDSVYNNRGWSGGVAASFKTRIAAGITETKPMYLQGAALLAARGKDTVKSVSSEKPKVLP